MTKKKKTFKHEIKTTILTRFERVSFEYQKINFIDESSSFVHFIIEIQFDFQIELLCRRIDRISFIHIHRNVEFDLYCNQFEFLFK